MARRRTGWKSVAAAGMLGAASLFGGAMAAGELATTLASTGGALTATTGVGSAVAQAANVALRGRIVGPASDQALMTYDVDDGRLQYEVPEDVVLSLQSVSDKMAFLEKSNVPGHYDVLKDHASAVQTFVAKEGPSGPLAWLGYYTSDPMTLVVKRESDRYAATVEKVIQPLEGVLDKDAISLLKTAAGLLTVQNIVSAASGKVSGALIADDIRAAVNKLAQDEVKLVQENHTGLKRRGNIDAYLAALDGEFYDYMSKQGRIRVSKEDWGKQYRQVSEDILTICNTALPGECDGWMDDIANIVGKLKPNDYPAVRSSNRKDVFAAVVAGLVTTHQFGSIDFLLKNQAFTFNDMLQVFARTGMPAEVQNEGIELMTHFAAFSGCQGNTTGTSADVARCAMETARKNFALGNFGKVNNPAQFEKLNSETLQRIANLPGIHAQVEKIAQDKSDLAATLRVVNATTQWMVSMAAGFVCLWCLYRAVGYFTRAKPTDTQRRPRPDAQQFATPGVSAPGVSARPRPGTPVAVPPRPTPTAVPRPTPTAEPPSESRSRAGRGTGSRARSPSRTRVAPAALPTALPTASPTVPTANRATVARNLAVLRERFNNA